MMRLLFAVLMTAFFSAAIAGTEELYSAIKTSDLVLVNALLKNETFAVPELKLAVSQAKLALNSRNGAPSHWVAAVKNELYSLSYVLAFLGVYAISGIAYKYVTGNYIKEDDDRNLRAQDTLRQQLETALQDPFILQEERDRLTVQVGPLRIRMSDGGPLRREWLASQRRPIGLYLLAYSAAYGAFFGYLTYFGHTERQLLSKAQAVVTLLKEALSHAEAFKNEKKIR